MKTQILSWAALLVALGCQATEAAPQEEGAVLTVRTEPAGATVRVNRGERTWTTPCEIPESFLKRGSQEVVLTLEGYEPVYRTVPTERKKGALLEVKLTPKSGAIVVENAVPGASVILLQVLADVKDLGTIIRLWSENEATLLAAIEKLPGDEVVRVAPRLQELAAAPPEKVAEAARKKAATAGEGKPAVEVVQRAIADIRGTARLTKIPVTQAYHLIATRPGSPDFVVANVKAEGAAPVTLRVPGSPNPAVEPPKPAPVPAAVEAAPQGPGRLRVKAPGGLVRVSLGDKVVAEVPAKADEALMVTVPAGRYRVEFVDAKTGAVTHTVETVAEREAEAPRDSERVGKVQLVHRVYGVFVRLDPGVDLMPGEDIAIYRDGQEVARTKIIQVCAGDETYPDGAAQVTREGAGVREGDEARRFK